MAYLLKMVSERVSSTIRNKCSNITPTALTEFVRKPCYSDEKHLAAVTIQRVWRGVLGRRKYLDRLIQVCGEEEARMEERSWRQCQDGMLLVENYRLQRDLEDEADVYRNRSRLRNDSAFLIQRAWRQKNLERVGQSSCQDTLSLPSAEQLSESDYIPAVYSYYPHNRNSLDGYTFRHSSDPPGGVAGEYGSDNELSHDDSLEEADVGFCKGERRKSAGSSIANSFVGDFFADDEFESSFSHADLVDRACDGSERLIPGLPSPTTDWDTIHSVLSSESDHRLPGKGSDCDELKDLSSRLSGGLSLQMTFVDDMESDIESTPDVEVYDVYDDDLGYLSRKPGSTGSLTMVDCNRNLDSRDSGYVPGDLVEFSFERVTDFNRHRDADSLEPVEESRRVLASLKIHQCHEKAKKDRELKKQREDARSMIRFKNIEELRVMKEELSRKVEEINSLLMCELMLRDDLHAKHESLLMDADDLAKMTLEQQSTGKKGSSSYGTRNIILKR